MSKIARFQMPDGRIGRFEVPDDSTPEQAQSLIAQSLQPQQPQADTPAEQPVRVVGQLGIHSRPLEQPKGDTIEEFGGRVTDKTGSPLLGTLARMAPDIATSFIGGPAGSLAKPGIRQTAFELMQSALKPTPAMLERGSGQKAVQTALDEGISASKGGIEKLQSLIEPIDTRIRSLIQASPAQVSESAFTPALQAAKDEVRFAPPSESNAVSKAIQDFKDKFYAGGGAGATLPVQDIQKIKQAYYKALGPESYGVITGGEREGMKAVARGAKEAVATSVLGVQKENDALGPLLNALDVVERRVNLAPNRDIGGLAWIAHSLKGMVMALAARDPYTKSILARGLNAASEAAPIGGAIGSTAATELANMNK